MISLLWCSICLGDVEGVRLLGRIFISLGVLEAGIEGSGWYGPSSDTIMLSSVVGVNLGRHSIRTLNVKLLVHSNLREMFSGKATGPRRER